MAPVAPPFSSSSGVLGTGLCELDRLLQELNATQFNITGTKVTEIGLDGMGAGLGREEIQGYGFLRVAAKRTQSLKWEGG